MHPKHPKPPKSTVHKAPLSQTRYEDLLRDMSRLFAEAEKPTAEQQAQAREAQRQARLQQQRDQEAEQQAMLQRKQQAIEDILATMAQHGLSVDDLT
jgi:cell division protein FtsN